MDAKKLETPCRPLGSGEKIIAHSVAFGSALAQKNLRSRHSAITSDLYSYHRYKAWTAKIRNAFEETK
jgi:hypothetical protein